MIDKEIMYINPRRKGMQMTIERHRLKYLGDVLLGKLRTCITYYPTYTKFYTQNKVIKLITNKQDEFQKITDKAHRKRVEDYRKRYKCELFEE